MAAAKKPATKARPKRKTATKKAARKRTSPRMSDAAVKAKTGKTWAQWFAALDKIGAKTMAHREITA